ncbi:bifunctional 23S rRNA (guanine(2069)-N(7))-methyltransferase RlmK/23S rRNA (guanine(2445)-N(2))-methyltransferase RlmL [Oleiagrimonas sp. MCCC 1A03011]|uniref:bifunctional 23S rRNA (guanine(2069)-N(7))-methyltransferase RlmK/23S rRNA (guanine(2445)-N(2))-methyltransferase RlmL n=1 Tax=Oleiagrimonas sp. MCCC 1A03011 TaxID=1926883 RepID=UPI000DC3C832|nr:bifunctional 23S rRNA (guanine(2069)-N(7))-methyltransferase RlmK/23S rRNA (guanine(2445)-N(2))-methyltransferase RlmL [Oleiagrimonas sp. MCCC 1A03011]RAP57378.1 23S rRNA (guanine(2445)-N(2))/(guanine(2069)-N(7))-methyltransferase [Oleiagrimonas sp. MCCC 1A03011]
MSDFFVSCPRGLEYLLRDELLALGATSAREALAGVHVEGNLEMAYRACLHSRLASRVLWPLMQFDAADEQALYDGVRGVDWAPHLAADGTLAVDAVVSRSTVRHNRYAAQRVKDAIVDQFREELGTRPSVDTERPDVRVHLRLKRNRAALSLDLSGAPLHRRGWRSGQGEAPLKENLAAAILLRAQWPRIYAEGGSLVDPMCGSGTLLIEAAWMAADVAPGLHRDYFGFLGWRGHDAALWQRLKDDAQARAEEGLRTLRPCFFGSDRDERVLRIAVRNAQAAGVAGFMRLERHDVAHLPPAADDAGGLIVTNPPYGERLGDRERLPALYHELGTVLRERYPGWHAAVLCGDAALGSALGVRADKRYALYNGALETTLVTFSLRAADAPPPVPKPLSDSAQMLANRLRKNLKHLRKRLTREGITCYRAYDQDLPEYALAIDVYEDWLHLQEYRAPADVPEHVAAGRVREAVRAAAEVFEVPRERIAVKQRRRGKGGSKYGQFDQSGEMIEVGEGGLCFLANLTDYLDTGLFLDHRLVRAKLRELASGRRFLNLFAYTATASVYAAAGGARETVSVDLSGTYLDWASKNLALNGFTGEAHRLAQADAMAWVREDRSRYGLIYVDPPTFSNSKRTEEDFDVQRDHVALLQACAARLEDGGVIVFSNNFRRFKLDVEALSATFAIQDWSAQSIPFDFARRADIHGCWLLKRHA